MCDLCIVGAGLVGSAAARHSSSLKGARISICLIGPKEPKQKEIITGGEVFGGHYDEGRITRMTDPDHVWATLAQKSIGRYRSLEQQSGVRFYEEVGCLMAGSENGQFMKNTTKTVADQHVDTKQLNLSDLKQRFPFLQFSDDDIAVYEYKNAGYISPRKLIEAQQIVASKNGCDIFNEIVSDVIRDSGPSGYHMVIKTENGRTITARKVLLATGAFTAFKNLLGPDCVPDMSLRPLTVAKVEISDQDAARLEKCGMPSILYYGSGGKDWWQDFPKTADDFFGWYMLPPVKYPDGKIYLKLGHFHDSITGSMTTLNELQHWYCQAGNSKLASDTAKLIGSFVKGINMLSFHGDYCAIQETPTNRPYIEKIHSQLGVSIGGNGYAAKSSDELGRISAMMMLKDKWDSEIPPETFKLKLKRTHSKL